MEGRESFVSIGCHSLLEKQSVHFGVIDPTTSSGRRVESSREAEIWVSIRRTTSAPADAFVQLLSKRDLISEFRGLIKNSTFDAEIAMSFQHAGCNFSVPLERSVELIAR